MIDTSTQWQLRGSSPKIYDEYIVPAVSEPWYSLLYETGIPYFEGTIGDVGCGTGAFLRFLLSKQSEFHPVQFVGIDLNSEMLAQAQNKIAASEKNISWVKADVENQPFPNDYFNLVYCQQGIQYFKDKIKALKEIYRTMKSSAVLIATVWSSIEECIGYKCLADAVLEIIGQSAQASLYSPFSYSDVETFKMHVQMGGFTSVDIQVRNNFVRFSSIKDFVWYRIHGSPLINNLPRKNHKVIIDTIVSLVKSSLEFYEGADGLIFPVKASYLIAKK